MKKLMIMVLMMIVGASALAKDCWMNPEGEFCRWERPEVITVDNLRMFSKNHSIENLERAGYRLIQAPDVGVENMYFDYAATNIYETFSYLTNEVIQIDAQTLYVANEYISIITDYFGETSLTNTAVSEDYILGYFDYLRKDGSITAKQLADANMLQIYFDILKESPYNAEKGTTWAFPFGLTEVYYQALKSYYIINEERVYIN